MKTTASGPSRQPETSPSTEGRDRSMTLSQLRHDIRNHLNAIKLSVALLQRRTRDGLSEDTLREIDRSADGINELVTRFLGDADAPSILAAEDEDAEL
jgi:hypothetical protein